MTEEQFKFVNEFEQMAKEELHPDLAPYVHEGATGWTVLQHPLVYQVPHMNNGLANRAYTAKVRQLYLAKLNKDYHSVVWLHERPYRFEAMTRLFEVEGAYMTRETRVEMIRDVWIDSENIWQHVGEWEDLFHAYYLRTSLTDDEKARLATLPDTVKIYRGATVEVNEDGLSWTLDHDRAVWFAKRLARDDEERIVMHGEVERDNIIALFMSRNEDEVLALPEHVRIKHYEDIPCPS